MVTIAPKIGIDSCGVLIEVLASTLGFSLGVITLTGVETNSSLEAVTLVGAFLFWGLMDMSSASQIIS